MRLADDRPTLVQLAGQLGVKPDTLRAWLSRNHAHELERAIRTTGAVVLIGPMAEAAARQHYGASARLVSTSAASSRQDDSTSARVETIQPPSSRHQDDVSDRLGHVSAEWAAPG